MDIRATRGTFPRASDHHALAAYWGYEAIKSIHQAVANPHPTTIEDLDLNHAVRCVRIAAYHAMKLRRG